jgi:hypothetical protein
MSRRIEIELTSSRDDGSWTWRAAGAREPRGTIERSLLPSSAKVGDVLRVDAEFYLDGIEITAVLPPKGGRTEPERIEIIGAPVRDDALVTSTLAPKGRDDRKGPRRDRPDRGDRPDRPRGDRDRDRGERPKTDRSRPDGGRRDRPASTGERPARPPRQERPERPPVEERPKAKRLRASKTHRNALLESLPAEQRPVAEQLLLGGLPAVRQAVDKQNEERTSAGEAEVNPRPLLSLAESLLPKVRAAEWRDRADAALVDVDDLDLRDLRSVVTASDAAGRDDESRQLAQTLREALSARVEKEHQSWLEELATTIADGRIVRALRISSRPPKAGSPLPKDLATKLVDATNASLTADASGERWAAVLDALAFAPVRRKVLPASLPEVLSEDLKQVIGRLAERLPEIAHIFAIEPVKGAPRVRPDRPKRPKKAAAKQADASNRPAKAGPAAEVEDATEGTTEDTTEPATDAEVEARAAEPAGDEDAVVTAAEEEGSAPDAQAVVEPEPESEPAPTAAEPSAPAIILTPVDEVDSVEEAIGTGAHVAPGSVESSEVVEHL